MGSECRQLYLNNNKIILKKIKAENNEIVYRKTIGKINETNYWFFEKINNISVARLRRIQIIGIRNRTEDIMTDPKTSEG